uniref:Uncharacterized protein n=1 Tax=Rhizophora mucronata TaxID=61149 RepID=A0A2P2QXL9_RHIMU
MAEVHRYIDLTNSRQFVTVAVKRTFQRQELVKLNGHAKTLSLLKAN